MHFSFVVSAQPTSFSGVALRGNLEESLALVAEAGYDGVELAVRDPSSLDLERLEALLKGLCLRVSAVGTGQAFVDEGLSITHADGSIREEAIKRVLSHLELASRWQATLIVGLIRGKVGDAPIEELNARFEGSMEAILKAAEALGARVALEPLNRRECDFVNTLEEALSWVEKFGSKSLGVLADTYHMRAEEDDMWAALERVHLKGKLFHVHVADSNRWAPGYGDIDWRGFVEAVKRMGYKGWISGEMQPKPSLEEAVKGTISLLKALL